MCDVCLIIDYMCVRAKQKQFLPMMSMYVISQTCSVHVEEIHSQGRRKQLALGTAECCSVPTVLYNVLSPSNNVMESHMYEMSIRIHIHNAIVYILHAI